MAYRKGQSPLTFHVPTDWHRRFKSITGAKGQPMRKVMMDLVTAWMDHVETVQEQNQEGAKNPDAIPD